MSALFLRTIRRWCPKCVALSPPSVWGVDPHAGRRGTVRRSPWARIGWTETTSRGFDALRVVRFIDGLGWIPQRTRRPNAGAAVEVRPHGRARRGASPRLFRPMENRGRACAFESSAAPSPRAMPSGHSCSERSAPRRVACVAGAAPRTCALPISAHRKAGGPGLHRGADSPPVLRTIRAEDRATQRPWRTFARVFDRRETNGPRRESATGARATSLPSFTSAPDVEVAFGRSRVATPVDVAIAAPRAPIVRDPLRSCGRLQPTPDEAAHVLTSRVCFRSQKPLEFPIDRPQRWSERLQSAISCRGAPAPSSGVWS